MAKRKENNDWNTPFEYVRFCLKWCFLAADAESVFQTRTILRTISQTFPDHQTTRNNEMFEATTMLQVEL